MRAKLILPSRRGLRKGWNKFEESLLRREKVGGNARIGGRSGS